MRPLRLLLSLSSCVLAVTLLLYIAIPARDAHVSSSPHKKSKLSALFSLSAPALFPPSAIISLTDDNSTFFLARPAAFGPPLPSKGLSGQLWTGSGFGGDTLTHGGLAAGVDGELGCSDVPGWDERRGRLASASHFEKASGTANDADASKPGRSRRGLLGAKSRSNAAPKPESKPLNDDGTDDHFHRVQPHNPNAPSWGKASSESSDHADIQSLQESAEIAGRVVLLRRGGCGFLEKVKWAQRRGGVAVIVGDDIRGGPLVTMYARGDTSNVTIPALFTSHTTAHLLSSLVPSGGLIENLPTEDSLKLALGKASKPSKGPASGPTFTSTSPASKQTAGRAVSEDLAKSVQSPNGEVRGDVTSREKPGWIRSLLAIFSSGSRKESATEESRRPPSSGNIDWILVEDWEDEDPMRTRTATAAAQKTSSTSLALPGEFSDDFVIGVQDWRDPDLLPPKTEPSINKKPTAQSKTKQSPGATSFSGGNVLPGSGEYAELSSANAKFKPASSDKDSAAKEREHAKHGGWFGNLPWNKQPDAKAEAFTQPFPASSFKPKASLKSTPTPTEIAMQSSRPGIQSGSDRHDGLWVTLTPTSMSNSPFFDTLLVLVVSPLVTLTVVYALLLLRSRIRRRRWRAPKSVVERLPVRTYQTLNSSDSSTSTSPIATPAAGSPRTPLLQSSSSSQANSSRNRPRSRTAGDVTPQGLGRSVSPEEKAETGLAAWRRKYGGRQKECVVCLEEYVDGVSRVMSLPCGHEFHAECM
ncbi:pa domain-containing protein [Diplodia corticola]|uniref:Pa domain-containing protein n=1 Tax=Diplodia corticola TaxID=236234 RepID=A0A1J9R7B2_9PEZI|nr:pa domain-containing protein [Diplodia corticola]OJD37414.1 pa domain-containing protein [Diplodia corticola]